MVSSGQSSNGSFPPPSLGHVLVIEDNAGDVELLTIAMATRGLAIRLTLAEDGDLGLVALQRLIDAGEPPDLVLLDLNMPRRNGFEVLAAISIMIPPSACPVAVWSSSTSAGDQDRSRAAGASRFFSKPEKFDDYLVLADALGTMLAKPTSG